MDFPAVLLGNSGWEDLAKIPPNTHQVPSKCGTLPGDGGASWERFCPWEKFSLKKAENLLLKHSMMCALTVGCTQPCGMTLEIQITTLLERLCFNQCLRISHRATSWVASPAQGSKEVKADPLHRRVLQISWENGTYSQRRYSWCTKPTEHTL